MGAIRGVLQGCVIYRRDVKICKFIFGKSSAGQNGFAGDGIF
jgi:hypothetical protein